MSVFLNTTEFFKLFAKLEIIDEIENLNCKNEKLTLTFYSRGLKNVIFNIMRKLVGNETNKKMFISDVYTMIDKKVNGSKGIRNALVVRAKRGLLFQKKTIMQVVHAWSISLLVWRSSVLHRGPVIMLRCNKNRPTTKNRRRLVGITLEIIMQMRTS